MWYWIWCWEFWDGCYNQMSHLWQKRSSPRFLVPPLKLHGSFGIWVKQCWSWSMVPCCNHIVTMSNGTEYYKKHFDIVMIAFLQYQNMLKTWCKLKFANTTSWKKNLWYPQVNVLKESSLKLLWRMGMTTGHLDPHNTWKLMLIMLRNSYPRRAKSSKPRPQPHQATNTILKSRSLKSWILPRRTSITPWLKWCSGLLSFEGLVSASKYQRRPSILLYQWLVILKKSFTFCLPQEGC